MIVTTSRIIGAGLIAFLCLCGHSFAQTAPQAPVSPVVPKKKANKPTTPPAPIVVETDPAAPQVVTLLHRLSGLKMFRLLVRSGYVQAIARLDDGFELHGDVHTNVIAGLALDDGETIAAWLPEVDAELGPPPPPGAPKAIAPSPSTPVDGPDALMPSRVAAATRLAATSLRGLMDSPDLTVIARDRQRLRARYIGLDGVTGLSVLQVNGKGARPTPSILDAREESITVGQRVRLFGPEPVPEEDGTSSPVYVRIGETPGTITTVMRAPSGEIARLKIKSGRVSAANIGGVAINDAGETLGIVDAVKGGEATILPSAVIRGAAKRVLERQASVPRPWLGVRGEQLGAFPLQQLLQHGWESQMVSALAGTERKGILLTSVAPGSPAFKAALKPGDLILRVNEDEIRTADDFSWILQEAMPGSSLRFTVARPGSPVPEAIEIKLSESPDPFFNVRQPTLPPSFEWNAPPGLGPRSRYAVDNALVANGIEAVALKPRVAAKLGSTGGLLVVYVQDESMAGKAGLRAGDVLEAINGKHLTSLSEPLKFVNAPGGTYTCNIVRNKQKMVLVVGKQ